MTTWNIDVSHTNVGFTVRHMMVSNVRGKFTGLEGTVEGDPDNLTDDKSNIKIDKKNNEMASCKNVAALKTVRRPGSHMMVYNVRNNSTELERKVEGHQENRTHAKMNILIDTHTINTHYEDHDHHPRS